MPLDADRKEWNDLARIDAMWAVCSVDGRQGNWNPQEFFASGEAEVAGILGGLEEQGFAPKRRRALDFGCGLGRLSAALATRFDEVIGVDISSEMITRARELNTAAANCDFAVSDQGDLSMFADASFDFVLSLIALQHVSSRSVIRTYIREFVRVAAPGSVIVFQLPSRVAWRVRAHPLRLANRVGRSAALLPERMRKALLPHSMRLVALPEREVIATLEAVGATVLAAFPDNRSGSAHVPSRTYVARA
jgi:SAM-dependent methyltransferase